MSVIGSNIIAGASGTVETGYQIARSLRFNSADSAYLNRTPAGAGSRTTFTISAWVKRSVVGSATQNTIFGIRNGISDTNTMYLSWSDGGGDTLFFGSNVGGVALKTTAVYRDASAFLHILAVGNTTSATASDRLQLYINGERVTAFTTAAYPSQNASLGFNQAHPHTIGGYLTADTSSPANFLNGYLADFRFIDGQALTPSSFGETDSATGVWVPKAYTGTYGTNGFWLKFDDNSNTTAATLGKDSSGNSNNWTPNNFSVTAGVGNDSLVDSPTNYGTDTGAGGEVRGNYATLNPLDNGGNTLANGNLDSTRSGSSWVSTRSTLGMSSGKWYWEITAGAGVNSSNQNVVTVGLMTSAATLAAYPGSDANGWGYNSFDGRKYNNQSGGTGTGTTYGATWTTGDVVGVAFDADAGSLTFYKNGVSQGSAYTSMAAGTYFAAVGSYAASSTLVSFNFGQRPFAYTAPSGFKALCTTNLPTPAIGASASTLASKNFNVVTWTGSNTAAGNSVTGVGFSPDFVWSKPRSVAYQHNLYDVIRGSGKRLISNSTAAEETNAAYGYLSSFDSDGFTTSAGATNNENWNQTSATYVAWNWKANGAGVSNTAGSLTSTVSANQTAGISIVTYTIPSASATIETFGHGLGRAPSMVILKVRGNVDEWTVYNANLTTPLSNWLTLNTTAAAGGATSTFSSSSTTFGVRGTRLLGSGTSGNIVAYCFAEIAGFSKFGSYTGNGSTDGPFVYTGFRPRFVLIKSSSDGTAGNDWVIIDTARNTFNESAKFLRPNLSNAEGDDAGTSPAISIDILSNGFKVRGTSARINTSSSTYIFAAFGESPFNYSRAR